MEKNDLFTAKSECSIWYGVRKRMPDPTGHYESKKVWNSQVVGQREKNR